MFGNSYREFPKEVQTFSWEKLIEQAGFIKWWCAATSIRSQGIPLDQYGMLNVSALVGKLGSGACEDEMKQTGEGPFRCVDYPHEPLSPAFTLTSTFQLLWATAAKYAADTAVFPSLPWRSKQVDNSCCSLGVFSTWFCNQVFLFGIKEEVENHL